MASNAAAAPAMIDPRPGSKRGRDQPVAVGTDSDIPYDDLSAIEEAAAVSVAPPAGGRRRKYRYSLKGGEGNCTDRSRAIIKALVLSSAGVGAYIGGPGAAATIGAAITQGATWLATAKCTIGYPGGIETALCTKYGELLTGISTIIATVTANAALGGITIAGLGAGAVYTVKGAVVAGKEAAVATVQKSNKLVDDAVDYICTVIYGSKEDAKSKFKEAAVQTDAAGKETPSPDAAATAAANKVVEDTVAKPSVQAAKAAVPLAEEQEKGQQRITAFMKKKVQPEPSEKKKKEQGGRRKTKKAVRRARRQTRRNPLKFVY